MEWSQVAELAPAKLVQLLDVERDIEWSEQYPAEILRHQLAAPLLPDLLAVPGADAAELRSLVRARRPGETFLDHLTSGQPSLELLIAIKSLAQYIKNNTSNPMHGDPATILYFSAIASAMVHCRSRITSLTNPQLREGFAWTLDQAGAQEMRPVLAVALRTVSEA
jgi:hypothetical protein